MLTREEEELFKLLSPRPKCMHDPKKVISLLSDPPQWKCEDCGLIAKQSIQISPFIFVNSIRE